MSVQTSQERAEARARRRARQIRTARLWLTGWLSGEEEAPTPTRAGDLWAAALDDLTALLEDLRGEYNPRTYRLDPDQPLDDDEGEFLPALPTRNVFYSVADDVIGPRRLRDGYPTYIPPEQ